MASDTETIRSGIPKESLLDRDGSAVEQRRVRPVMVWATIGALFLLVEVIALSGWISSGQATPTPKGPTPVPSWMNIAMRSWEVAGVFVFVAVVYYFLVRPWRREGHIGIDGLLAIAFISLFWQDTIPNYFQTWITYNANFFNLGAWNPHIIGWLSPNANQIPEPLIWLIPIYGYFMFGAAVVGNFVMRKIKGRWPGMGTFGLVALCFAFFVTVDMIFEPLWLRFGFYAFPGSIEWLTLFHGNYYQYPVYEAVLGGGAMTAFGCIRYFRNDKGQTLAERGIERVNVNGGKRTALRLLAVVGFVNFSYCLFYTVPMAISGLYASPWPEDILKRSYLTNGNICGPNSTYACSGPGVPIPRRDSAHMSPDGTLVKPDK